MDWGRNEKAAVKLPFFGAPVRLRVAYALLAGLLWRGMCVAGRL